MLDIYLKSERFPTPEAMANVPVQTPNGGVVPLGELAQISAKLGPSAIVRFDRKRAYSLAVNPPPGMTLETLLEDLQTKVEPALLATLPTDGRVTYAGNAEDLAQALESLLGNGIIALVLLFLILTGLFRSLLDALLIFLSIPLAGVGGVMLLNMMQLPLDLLGMIGFIILLGLVVNNAILLVAGCTNP